MQWDITDTVISIHALLAESDSPASVTPAASRNFYPRSPCGERPHPVRVLVGVIKISIHALLAESDQTAYFFLSDGIEISIHALLAESDRRRGVHCYLDNIISIHALLAESDRRA